MWISDSFWQVHSAGQLCWCFWISGCEVITFVGRSYHFASPSYVSSFGEFPPVDVKTLRSDTVKYLENFESKAWFDDPVCTLIRGQALKKGDTVDTVDAFGNINGKQILATPEVVNQVVDHVKGLSPGKDYRAAIRRIEERLLSEHAAFLIGNQALDFYKQDGVTEIEESIEANVVERKLNDLLLEDELAGRVRIQRHTALVGCVSNFSNFLDLCRKSLRNIELGIPVLILSRSNTTQHIYRWVQLLLVPSSVTARQLDSSVTAQWFTELPFFTTVAAEVGFWKVLFRDLFRDLFHVVFQLHVLRMRCRKKEWTRLWWVTSLAASKSSERSCRRWVKVHSIWREVERLLQPLRSWCHTPSPAACLSTSTFVNFTIF